MEEKWIAIELYVVHGRTLDLKVTKGKEEPTIIPKQRKSKIFQTQQLLRKKNVNKSKSSIRAA